MAKKIKNIDEIRAVCNRLKQVVAHLNYADNLPGLALHLGYERPDNIYNALSGEYMPGIQLLADLSNKFENVNLGWILTGKGSMVIEDKKETPAGGGQGGETMKDLYDRLDENLMRIEGTILDSQQHILLTESLSRSLVSHAAYMEHRHFGVDYDKVLSVLNEVTATAYKTLRGLSSDDQQSKVA